MNVRTLKIRYVDGIIETTKMSFKNIKYHLFLNEAVTDEKKKAKRMYLLGLLIDHFIVGFSYY